MSKKGRLCGHTDQTACGSHRRTHPQGERRRRRRLRRRSAAAAGGAPRLGPGRGRRPARHPQARGRRPARQGVQQPRPDPRAHDRRDGSRRDGDRPRGPPDRPRGHARRQGHLEGQPRVREHDDRRPVAPDPRGRARDRRGRRGRSEPEDAAEDRGPPGQGRVPAHRPDRQLDGRPALVVRRRGDARRPRGRHRGQARRAGQGEGPLRDVEGPDRQRERHGVEPDVAGAQHRRGDDGRRERRPHSQDHGGREGRGARAQEHDQHDGRPAVDLRRRGHARRARGRHGGQARRPGRRQGRRRHVEGPDRQREPDGLQPDDAGARRRSGRHRRGRR